MKPQRSVVLLRMTQESVTLSESEESRQICKTTEKGLVHRNELNLFSRIKNGIFWDLLGIPHNPTQ